MIMEVLSSALAVVAEAGAEVVVTWFGDVVTDVVPGSSLPQEASTGLDANMSTTAKIARNLFFNADNLSVLF
jgi:antitoxin (DNA-binding transcriptional repressor) of toxin-antitoxin stability system